MAREVEADLVVNDKTAPGLDAAARKIQQEQEKLTRNQKRESDKRQRQAKKEYDDNLTSLRGSLGKASKLVEQFSPQLAQSLGKSLAGASDILVPAIAGLAVSAAPLLGATISGAIIGAAGLGGIVGGVLVASKDPRVKAAFSNLSTGLQAQLTDAAASMVPATLNAVERIKASLNTIDFSAVFDKSAQNLPVLTEGISRAITSLGDGIESLVAGSGPVIAAISAGIAGIGEHIGSGLKSLSDNGPQAAAALQTVFGVIDSAIDSTFRLVNLLTELYGIGQKIGADFVLQTALKLMGDQVKPLAPGTAAAAAQIAVLGAQAAVASGPIQDLSDRINDLASAGQSLYSSTTQVGEATAKLSASIKENGRSLSANTAKGRENRDALSGLASALSANYQAYVKVNGEGRGANTVAGQNRAAFIKAAEGFHIGQAAAEKLATKLGLIPAKKATSFTANTHDAAARIAALQGQINSLHNKTVTLTVRTVTAGGVHVSGGSTGSGGTQVKNAANAMWAANAGGGTSRTGGPTQVNSSLDLSVNLDGRPFRQMTKQIVADSDRRNDYKRRVPPR